MTFLTKEQMVGQVWVDGENCIVIRENFSTSFPNNLRHMVDVWGKPYVQILPYVYLAPEPPVDLRNPQ